MKICVTGGMGFIGAHVARALYDAGHEVFIVDPESRSYFEERRMYELRYKHLLEDTGIKIFRGAYALAIYKPDTVVHLGALPGIEQSIHQPVEAFQRNVTDFFNILMTCGKIGVKNFLYASSSSVYGDGVSSEYEPKNLYAFTKLLDEQIAEWCMNNPYIKVPESITGFRFFTVYGEYGRLDMAVHKFLEQIHKDGPLRINDCWRSFTYVGDIVKAILKKVENPDKPGTAAVWDIGSNEMLSVRQLYSTLLKYSNIPEDRKKTMARLVENIPASERNPWEAEKTRPQDARRLLSDDEITLSEEGLRRTVEWYEKIWMEQ